MRTLRLVILLACAPLGACQDYLARRDTMTVGSGDAVHTNMAKHVIDPWPAHARTIESTSDGERAQHAMERYRNPGSGQQSIGLLPPIPVGAANAPASAPAVPFGR